MRLRVLGCSGSFPGPESPASGYLVESEWPSAIDGRVFRLVLDMGNGTFGVLQKYADPYAIDAVGLSHLHPDHCHDLCSYYVARRYHPDGPRPTIPVYGPYATADRMAVAYGLPLDPGMRREFNFQPWPVGEPLRCGPLRVTTAVVEHPVAAYGIRVERDARSLVYSGDTGPCHALIELAGGADVFICEATFAGPGPHPTGVHLTGAEAGRHAAEAGVGRLVLTHVPPWTDPDQVLCEARAEFDGPIELARAGALYEL